MPQIDDTDMTTKQSDEYADEHVPAIVASVSKQTGNSLFFVVLMFTGLTDLTNDLVETMWSACQYDVSVFNITDEWCTLFNESEAEVFETIEDLEKYYENVNVVYTCDLLHKGIRN